MFAIGHFALGYLFGKGTSRLAHVKINLPLLLAASVLPDIDLLFRFLTHRGPTHSFLAITVLMLPFFIIYRKKALPYYAAILSHICIGDFLTGGIELFWPLSHQVFLALPFEVNSLPIALTELILFLATIPIMFKTGDLKSLLQPINNWVLIIPFGATLGPLFALGRGQEAALPLLLVIPSVFCLVLFGYSMIIWLMWRFKSESSRMKALSLEKVVLNPFAGMALLGREPSLKNDKKIRFRRE